jgi:hypothetical protein
MMDFGVYVLHETTYPAGYSGGPFYYLIVDDDGTVISSPDDGYATQADAKSEGDKLFKDRQNARKAAANP